MKLLPPAPWLAEEEGRGVRGEGGEGVEVLDVSGVEIQLMSESEPFCNKSLVTGFVYIQM